jgi:hypothetical protein
MSVTAGALASVTLKVGKLSLRLVSILRESGKLKLQK